VYITNAQLRVLLEEAHQAGKLTPDLAEAFVKIARGYFSRHGVHYRFVSVDDFVQQATLRLLEKFQKIDPDRNPFNYLTRHCQFVLMEITNSHARHQRILDGLKQRA